MAGRFTINVYTMLIPDGMIIAPAPAAAPEVQKPAVIVAENELHVRITREMWSDFFMLHLDNGQSEELEPEPLREWFRIRGADMDKMERVIDQAWNFQRAEVIISNPKIPKLNRSSFAPEI